MKDFFTEEIEGKTATLTLPEKSPKKDFYSEEIENDFYSKEVKPSIFPKEKTIPEIKQAPPKTISEKIKSFFREPPVAGIAKAQNIYAISKTTGIPLQDVRKNYEGLVRQEKITGIRPDIGKKEYMALVTAPLVATGLVTHPIGAIAGLTTFGILNKLIPTEKFIPSDINDDVKTAIELADFIGKAAITGAVFKKAPLAIEKFTKNKFTEFNLPKTIKLTAGQVKDIYQTGKLTTPEQQSLFGSLGLTNKQTKIALEKGIDINIPAEKLVKLTDKPYWQKIKSVFGIKPYEKVTTTLAQKPTVALAGLLPEPVVTPIAPKVTPTIPSIAPTIPQIPPKSPIVVPITPQIPIVAPKAITPPITPPEVTAPPIKPEVALGKKELLKQLDEAIEKAPLTLERVTTEFPKTISFKIDGGVDIVNTKDALTFFRKRVKGVSTEIFGKPSIKPTGIPKVKDFYKEEVETPAAFAGTIAEEIPAITAPSAEIVKRSQIISNLGEKLNVPIRKGGFGGAEVATRGALGIYKPKPDIIRWKSGGVGTISHEIGHFLDDNFRDLHELIIASRPEIGPLDYNPMKQRANEGFSEFLRYWTTQPEIALKKAPQFHTQFETWLNNNPDVRTVLDNARQNYQAWLKMPSVDKVKSQISFEPEAQVQGIKHTVDSLYSKVGDELAPIQRYVDLAKKQGIKILDEENPYVLARLLKGNTGKANHFLNYKTFNTKLEITGKGLREVLEPIKNNL